MKFATHPLVVFVVGVLVGTYFGGKIHSGLSGVTAKVSGGGTP